MGSTINGLSNNYDGPKPCFINSLPIGEDLLEGKSQEQIAESICQFIRDDRIENRLLGIDGAWGSGKSNLLKILEYKLRDTHHVFFYDAWGHQEDLQRRTFLEELTENLCDNELINHDTWHDKLKDLLSRKRQTVEKTIPKLGPGVIATLLVVVFTPIAKSIADSIDHNIFKILITSVPLLIGILMWILGSLKRKHFLSISEIYCLYKDKDLVSETNVTISEQESSVREFRGWMNDLSKELLKKKLLVIFDNMDRLPPERVRELWSSIHTFFAEQSFKGIWVIIPFDNEHLAHAFNDDEEISEQFLLKSFPIIYRVAPPVLTDWQKFFDLKFKDAFGNIQEHELQYVRKIFDRMQEQITPRSIISFINEMVSIYLTVRDDILLRYIAIFVLAKKDILKSPVDQILNLEFLKKASSLFKDDQELSNQIAALVYQVPLSSASQVSLTREIQQALREKNDSRLNQLSKHRHFIAILEQVIAMDDLDIESTVATLSLLDDSFTKADETIRRIIKIWDTLSDKAVRIPFIEQIFSETHALLLQHSSDPKRINLVDYIVKGIRNAEDFRGDRYFSALSMLNECIKENSINVNLFSLLPEIKKAPNIFTDYIKIAGENYKSYKLICEESEFIDYISKRVPNELEGLSALSVLKSDFNLSPIIECLENEILNNTITAENIENFYIFYKAITKEKPIKPIEDGQIVSLLSQVKESSDAQIELIAMRLARTSKFTKASGISQTILSENDEKLVIRIASIIEYYTNYGDLLLEFISWQQPLLKAVLRNLTLISYGTQAMDIINVIQYFTDILRALEIEADDFITQLNGWAKYFKERVTIENIIEVILDAEFFSYAINIDCELTRHAISIMGEYLKTLSVDEWAEPLRDVDSYLFKVTYLLLYSNNLKKLPDNAVSVYKEILIEYAKGTYVMEDNDVWEIFYERTHKGKLKATIKNIRDYFLTEKTITAELFLSFANMFLQQADLKQKSADVARKILSPVAKDDDCLSFIIEKSEFFTSLINEAGDDASDFKDIIRQKVLLPDCSNELIAFANSIGIELAISNKTEDQDHDVGESN